MDFDKAKTIDIVEASYNLDLGAGDWLPNLCAAGGSTFDFGLGFYAALLGGVAEDGQPLVTQLHSSTGGEERMMRFFEAARIAGPELVGAWSRTAATKGVCTMSDLRDEFPDGYKALTEPTGCKDGLMVGGIDPDGHGVSLQMLSGGPLEPSRGQRERWKMLGIHLASGFRLRRGLVAAAAPSGVTCTDIPLDAEALLDPSRFLVTQAAGGAQDKAASKVIREAAVRVDKARGKLRKSNPAEALEIWHGLVRGRWSLVDWFDTDGRRFVLAKPNAPNLGDPRGLTDREHQVATYAARGESSKLIAYRFGLSPQRVSMLLTSSMRKLGVKTPAQLVEKMRGFPAEPPQEEAS